MTGKHQLYQVLIYKFLQNKIKFLIIIQLVDNCLKKHKINKNNKNLSGKQKSLLVNVL